jgi:hypothetical protein
MTTGRAELGKRVSAICRSGQRIVAHLGSEIGWIKRR